MGSIRDHCFSDGGNDVADAMTENGKMIASDFRYFQEEVWYRMKDDPPFDANKFIFLYSNYQSHQQHLLELWKIVDVKKLKFSANWNKNGSEAISERWKYAIRKYRSPYLEASHWFTARISSACCSGRTRSARRPTKNSTRTL